MTLHLSGDNLVIAVVIAIVLFDLVVAGGGMMTGMAHVLCTPWGGMAAALVTVVLVAVLL